jgi:nitroreductase
VETLDAMSAILGRRSIRKYTPEPVSDEMSRQLLAAAMAAPSAHNARPCHFVVVRQRPILNDLAGVLLYGKMLGHAPLAIAVCAEVARSEHLWECDGSAATENILIAAHALGLGAAWLAVHPAPDRVAAVARLLGLPPGITPLCLVAVGHPAEVKAPVERFDETRVHSERW